MSLSPLSSSSHGKTLLSLKRHIAVLEELNAELRTPPKRKECTTLGTTDCSDAEAFESSNAIENRWYWSYTKLVMWCPLVKMLMQSSAESSELAAMCNKLNWSADAARGDDTTSLKFAVASWLMQTSPTLNPIISN
ncbi:uncharacterized protein EDB91DRAFT_1079351 [Suillus paluster]|uniref:uncharacterized protein n=1 Tax=Suillus paluster TaxID=48578 RepID=UPI001B86EDCA|nr:uncharacterized protein EDB91DRAFT_1079351 [Suillus paluster]KAG1748377.1 hypothetical protein EDB91DRAFT_1079351 [Suillus paluster]